MRILLIGRTGQLGGDLVRNNPGHDLIAPARDELDLGRSDQVREAVEKYHPEVVINCAAFHNVPRCEEQPETAFRVNCVAMRDLAATCQERDIKLVTFSSDYVFGGEKRTPYGEADFPAPLQIYGMSRLAGEYAVLSAAPNQGIVIRTCGLYGQSGAASKGGNFVDGRVADGLTGKTVEMSADQTVAPTSTSDLSKAVFSLISHDKAAPGIYHLINEGQCTWYEFTQEIIDVLALQAKVVPVDRGGRTGSMRRPLYSVLANNKAKALGITLPPWREALRRYLEIKYASLAHMKSS